MSETGSNLDEIVSAVTAARKYRSVCRDTLYRIAERELGNHPEDGKPVSLFEGRYGPYVKHGKINATIPKDQDVEQVTLEQAIDWIAVKAAKKSTKSTRKTVKKAAPKKKTKKAAAKKTKKTKAPKGKGTKN